MSTGYSPLRRWLRANERASKCTRIAAMATMHEIARLLPDCMLLTTVVEASGRADEDWLNWEYARRHFPGRDCDFPARPCATCEADPRIMLAQVFAELGAPDEILDALADGINSGRVKVRHATPDEMRAGFIKRKEFRRNEDGTFTEVPVPDAQSPR
jgi:hypothetical protein